MCHAHFVMHGTSVFETFNTLLLLCTGYTLFVEDESARANALLSRGDMESVMVVHLAGRSAEKLVMGEGEVRHLFWLIVLCCDMAVGQCTRGRRCFTSEAVQHH